MAYSLAQLNIARLLHPRGDARVAEFFEAVGAMNVLAESAPGFVWRFEGDPAPGEPWSDDALMLVNLSVWESPEALKSFAYRSAHVDFYLKRALWFEKLSAAHATLWWVPAGHTPSLGEAHERLETYRREGPTARAFWFSRIFPAPEE